MNIYKKTVFFKKSAFNYLGLYFLSKTSELAMHTNDNDKICFKNPLK